ncbi:MAG: DUF6089 family protein [Saprospiraceae bacterium]
MYKFILPFIFLFLFSTPAFTQNSEIGGALGITFYQGDLVETPLAMKGGGFTGIFIYERYLNEKFSLRFDIAGGSYKGNDRNFPAFRDRDFEFEAQFAEATANLKFNLLKRGGFSQTGIFRGSFSPYACIGVGVLRATPDPIAEGRIKFDPRDENPNTTHFIIPIAAGLRFDFESNWVFAIEIKQRTTFTDYLDGFSFSANPNANDWLAGVNIVVTYIIGQENCSMF